MAYMTPEEFLEKHGKEYLAIQFTNCSDICQQWCNGEETYSTLPDGPEKTALGKQNALLALLIKAHGCKCPPLK